MIIRALMQRTSLDGKVELDEKQFETILLILDVSIPKPICFVQALSEASSKILRQILLIYKCDCSKDFLISQQKRLVYLLQVEVNQQIIKELTSILEQLRSIKLKLLIERIIEFHQKMEKDISLEYLEFEVFLPQDQEVLSKHTQFANQQRNYYQQPQQQIPQQFQNQKFQQAQPQQQQQQQQVRFISNKISISIIYQFLNIISMASKLDSKQIDAKQYDELSSLISDEVGSFGTTYDPTLFPIRQKIRDALVYLLQLQKLELKSFENLWYLSEQLKLYLERATNDIQINSQRKQTFPFLNSIISTYKNPIKESIEYTQLKTEILKEQYWNVRDTLHIEFHNMMKIIENYDGTNQQNFLQIARIHYQVEFKQYLEKLKNVGSNQVKSAVNLIIQTQ
ncbi:unnamed protein product (macronuclear) [Paramecium tetraurelia]|uniref:Uncharacterized protein n=1 Tax=Paramecium tetraurelia TaxID=5888 RepID=A0DLP5_PARTE|nr:uncharacterized protein GSPATT00039594001 [Paramecium tetraurelia]CAK83962.1 unnamed protein product [Paramecium tetraurelia]|eukprot:XP_001451359.1 hypothetical protein (macronuclear) [Paramecium tetraurelia strain d4-2]